MKSLFSVLLILFIATSCIGQDAIDTSKVYMMAEQMPQFKGGVDSLGKYISTHTLNPRSKEGTVYVNFVVTRTGKVINPKILKGVANAPELDSAAMSCIAGMPDWIPGKQGSIDVNVACNLPIKFAKADYYILEGDTIYYKVEKNPEYFGGDPYRVIGENINYPYRERINDITGVINLAFIVEKDGEISNILVLTGIPSGPGLSKEATREVSLLKHWNPATNKGKPVSAQCFAVIDFELKQINDNSSQAAHLTISLLGSNGDSLK